MQTTKGPSLGRRRTRGSGVKKRQTIKATELKVGEGEGEVEFEKKYVHEVYDTIAPHFAHTRYKPWPGVKSFILSQKPGSTVLEVGCGNGRNLWANEDIFVVGCDLSLPLVKFASESGKELARASGFLQCDCLALPFKDESYDACMMIAVLHHLASRERRLEALKEMYRILIKGGLLLITVWGFEDNVDEFHLTAQDSAIRWQTEPQHMRSKKEPPDDTKTNNEEENSTPAVEIYTRYYHFFVEKELPELCKEAGFDIVLESEAKTLIVQGTWTEDGTECRDHSNWVVVARK